MCFNAGHVFVKPHWGRIYRPPSESVCTCGTRAATAKSGALAGGWGCGRRRRARALPQLFSLQRTFGSFPLVPGEPQAWQGQRPPLEHGRWSSTALASERGLPPCRKVDYLRLGTLLAVQVELLAGLTAWSAAHSQPLRHCSLGKFLVGLGGWEVGGQHRFALFLFFGLILSCR